MEWHWREIWLPSMAPSEVAFRAAVVYLFVWLLFRISHRKELTRYSVFDIAVLLLITVAARTTILGNDSSLTSGGIALVVILSINELFSYLSYRSDRLATLLEGRRAVLVRDGKLDGHAMHRAMLTEDELRTRLRRHGTEDLGAVERAYMEHNGEVTFVLRK